MTKFVNLVYFNISKSARFFIYRGQLPADAEFNFLDHAKRLDMYGVELHKARVHNTYQIEKYFFVKLARAICI